MEVDGSTEPPHELKRKRLDDPDDEQDTLGQIRDATPSQSLDGSTESRIDANGTKRIKIKDPDGHIKSYSRVEIPEDKSKLPGEIWQYIFTFLAPPTLTRLLTVNHGFRDLLSKSKSDDASSIGGYLKFLDSDFIWTASRRLFFPNMPRPLASRNELEMWRLVSGRTCQFCRKKESPEPGFVPNQPWNGGPGTDGVRIIWPFGVRSCGECLNTRMKKEMDVMFSSSIPSALLPALPFAFFTSTLDYVSPLTVQANSPPPNITMSKYYYQDHLDDIKRKFEDVRALGGSTAEEWFKGLEGTGRDMQADALRWERWDAEGGISRVQAFRVAKPEVLPNLVSLPEIQATAKAPPSVPVPVQSNHAFQPTVSSFAGSQPMAAPPGSLQTYPVPAPASGGSFYPGYAPGVPQPAIQYGMGPPGAHPQSGHLPPKPTTPLVPMSSTVQYPTQFQPQYAQPRPMPINTPIQPHVPQPRAERSIRDVNEAKAQRRADIERRCMVMDPPIKPSTLVHMESFAAAIQIPMALTDGAWEVLKPRLLAQKETAEEREREQLQQSQILQARTEERRQQEAALREAKENMDRQWDESQKPLRDKLSYYADEILKIKWGNGQLVTKENCPQFAADVLVYVRKRFYQILEWEDGVVHHGGLQQQDHLGSGSNRKLTLENMKWVYDTKVKPLTEPHSKEIFLCNGCDGGNKYYGFEGVIQHYAAKHTNVLSMGSIVVHWKADWPEDPPFDPDPSRTSAVANQQYQGQQSPQNANALDGGNQVIRHDSPPNPQSYQQYSPSTIVRPSYASSAPYQSSQYAMSPALGSAHSVSFNSAPQYSQQSGHRNVSQPYHTQYPGQSWSPAFQPTAETHPPLSAGSPQQYGTPQSAWPAKQSFSSQQQPRPSPSARLGPPGQPFGIYQVQLEEVSKNAREIFDATAAVKDFPSSIRIYVIISHVVVRFKDRFTNEPTLSLFTDALNNSSQMKPLRGLSDLACKACSIGAVDASEMNKLYTLPALLTHFQSVHIEQARPVMINQPGIESPRTDWKFDMVKLPSNSEMLKLMDAPGMTDAKLKLVATIIPWVFPSPLPEIGYREPYVEPGMTGSGPADGDTRYSAGPTSRGGHLQTSLHAAGNDANSRFEAGPSSTLEVAVDDFPRFVESPSQDATQALEPAGEDEYDPHRPAYREPTPASYSRFDHSKNRPKDSKPMSTWQPVLSNGHQMGGDSSNNNARLAQVSRDLAQQRVSGQSQQQQRAQSINAAEQFLNNFDPNEDRDTYEPPEYISPVLNAQPQSVRQYSPVGPVPPAARHTSWNEAPTYGTENSWNRQGYEANQEVRTNNSAFSTQGPHGPTPMDQDRYGQTGNENIFYIEQQPRRPSSRFDGYEPDRQASTRPRSRSPHATSSLPSSNRYYRARSPIRDPGPAYGTQQLVREREYYPQGEVRQYAPEAHRQQYPPDLGYNEHTYDAPVEYVRMPPRESHGLPTYYVDRQLPTGGQYVQFDEPVFEHNGQLYRRSQVPPDAAVERQYYR